MRKRFDDEVAEVMAILDRPDPKAAYRSAEAALSMALASGEGPLRRKYLAKAQKYIARMDPEQEAEDIQELQGHILALLGRGGDTRIAHGTRGEVVIPPALQTPEMMAALARAARQAGLDPRRFQVGQGRVNPRTGHEEFFDATEDQRADGASNAGTSSGTPAAPGSGRVDGVYPDKPIMTDYGHPNPEAKPAALDTLRKMERVIIDTLLPPLKRFPDGFFRIPESTKRNPNGE